MIPMRSAAAGERDVDGGEESPRRAVCNRDRGIDSAEPSLTALRVLYIRVL